jgi:hypothetical protein
MERPVTWQNAFRDLESELCDARNMARITAYYIADDCSDPELLAFAIRHTASLAENLHEKWNTLFDQLSALKAA